MVVMQHLHRPHSTGGTTITFNDAGDSVILVYNTTVGWVAVSNQGATIA